MTLKFMRSLRVLACMVVVIAIAEYRAHADSAGAADVVAINAVAGQSQAILSEAIVEGNFSNMAAALLDITAMMLSVTPAPQTQEGVQLISLDITFFGFQVAAAACQQIPKYNPTIPGVNLFLACINPINTAIVATASAISNLQAAMLQGGTTVLGPGPHISSVPVDTLPRVADIVRQVASPAEDTALSLLGLRDTLHTLRSVYPYVDRGIGLINKTDPDALNHVAAQLGEQSIEDILELGTGYRTTMERAWGLILGNAWTEQDLQTMTSPGLVIEEVSSFAQSAVQEMIPATTMSLSSLHTTPTVRLQPVGAAQAIRSAHADLVTNIYLPGIDTLAASAELTSVGGEVARNIRVPLELAWTEALIRATLRNRFGHWFGDILYAASVRTWPSEISAPTPEALRVTTPEEGATLTVDLGGRYVLHSGDNVPVHVIRRSDGADLSAAEETIVLVIGGSQGINAVANVIQVHYSDTPFAAIPHVGWVIVANGGNWGAAQFVMTDVDKDGDLLGDAWETSRGLDPTLPNDAIEVLAGIPPRFP